MRIVYILLIIFIVSSSNSAYNQLNLKNHLNRAEDYFQQKKFKKARKAYTQYLDKYHDKLAVDDRHNIYNQLVRISLNIKDYSLAKSAIDSIKSGLARIEKLSPIFLQSSFLVGEYHKEKWDALEAIPFFEKIIHTNQKNKVDSILLLNTYSSLGYCNRYILENVEVALKYFLLEQELLDNLKNPPAKQLIKNRYNLATSYRINEEYGLALTYIESAYSLSRINFPNDKSFHAKCSNILATTHANLGDLKKAEQYLLKTINMAESLVNENFNLSYYYANLGRIYFLEGALNKAEAYYSKAIPVTKNTNRQTEAYIGLSECFFEQENFENAFLYLEKALSLIQEPVGLNHPAISRIYAQMSDFYIKMGQLDSALFYVQEAIISKVDSFNQSSIFDNPSLLSIEKVNEIEILLLKKSHILNEKYLDSSLPQYLNTALEIFDLLDEHRKKLIGFSMEAENLHFLDMYQKIYAEGIRTISIKQKKSSILDKELLFNYFEKGKANLLLKNLNNKLIRNKLGSSDILLEEEKRLNDSISFLSTKSTDVHKNELIEVLKDKQDLLAQLSQNEGKYYHQFLNPVSLKNFQFFLKKNNAQVIQYYESQESIFIIYIDGDELIFKEKSFLPTSKKIVHNLANILTTNPLVDPKKTFADFQKHAFSVYQVLIKPIEKHLKEDKELIIIPDGLVSVIPFDVLINQKNKESSINYKKLPYLIRKFDIRQAYSASTLYFQSSKIPRKKIANILTLSYSDETTIKDAYINSNDLPELPSAQKESELLKNQFTQANTTSFTGKNASKKNFLTNVINQEIIHLVTHASNNNKNPNLNKIHFRNNNYLTQEEIYGLNLNAGLVVLNACETGIGKFHEGEGIFSFSRSFSYAGVPSVIMSLWQIGDRSAFEIMQTFYQNISFNSLSISMRRAKLDYLDKTDEIGAFPGHWSAFQVIGSNHPFELNTFNLNQKFYFFFLAFSIFSLFVLIKSM